MEIKPYFETFASFLGQLNDLNPRHIVLYAEAEDADGDLRTIMNYWNCCAADIAAAAGVLQLFAVRQAAEEDKENEE